jgi:D-serine deaminase-like pyridoxal phosphate-dependent protein
MEPAIQAGFRSAKSLDESLFWMLAQVLRYELSLAKTLQAITSQGEKIMSTFADLQTAVTNETTVEASVITLLNGISAQLAAALAAGGSPTQIQAVIDQVNANAAAAAAAVTANTPAAKP